MSWSLGSGARSYQIPELWAPGSMSGRGQEMAWASRTCPSFPGAPEKATEAQAEPETWDLSHHARSFLEHR